MYDIGFYIVLFKNNLLFVRIATMKKESLIMWEAGTMGIGKLLRKINSCRRFQGQKGKGEAGAVRGLHERAEGNGEY